MNELDSTRYSVAMQAYIRHLAETLNFWKERDDREQEVRARRKLDNFMATYKHNEVSVVYKQLSREVREILGEEWTSST